MNANHRPPDPQEEREARLTAYALGQLDGEELASVEAELSQSAEARRTVAAIRKLSGHVRRARREAAGPAASDKLRAAVEHRLHQTKEKAMKPDGNSRPAPATTARRGVWLAMAVAVCLLVAGIPVWMALWGHQGTGEGAGQRELAQADADRTEAAYKSASRAYPSEYRPTSAAPSPERTPPRPVSEWTKTSSGNKLESGSASGTYDWSQRLSPPCYIERPEGRGIPEPAEQGPSVQGQPGPPAPTEPSPAEHYPRTSDATTATDATQPGNEPGDLAASDDPLRSPSAPGTEQYERIVENPFVPVLEQPKSTFGIDVDTASYANVRRFLTHNSLPPPDAVRIEEMVNYFRYDYAGPEGDVPFAVHMEVAPCPWKADHRLLRIGLKGKEIDPAERGPSNLVFLLDVSGSMQPANKLPLVKQAMTMLTEQLTENDYVAIVTYASNAGVRLESTCASDKGKILAAIDSLQAGGSTHGSAGIQTAYEQALRHFIEGGTNRVILCTDGDLNVGITDDKALTGLIEEKARSGVFLTVFGFGTGNLKDAKMEKLADHGNGLYAYVDNLREAHKLLVEQMTGSLMTIAKDVKIQIEFNPAEVERYRLIGYENRLLAAHEFDDDTKDAGDIGAGHTVTALYELVPASMDSGKKATGGEGLKYQLAAKPRLSKAAKSGELLTLDLRYKQPDEDKSTKLEFTLADSGKRFGEASTDFQFAAAVAGFGMILRGSQYRGDATLVAVEEIAQSALGDDPDGYRAEFLDLVRRARQITGR